MGQGICGLVTLSLMTVPVVIVATEEGLSAVPREYQEGSLGLGAAKLESLIQWSFPCDARDFNRS